MESCALKAALIGLIMSVVLNTDNLVVHNIAIMMFPARINIFFLIGLF